MALTLSHQHSAAPRVLPRCSWDVQRTGALSPEGTREHNWPSWAQFSNQWITFPFTLGPPLNKNQKSWTGLSVCSFAVFRQLTPTLKPGLYISSDEPGLTVWWQFLSFIQLQANKLLHALPVLHLGGAVGVILTWLAEGPLRLSHLFVHLGQSQPGGQVKKQEVTD